MTPDEIRASVGFLRGNRMVEIDTRVVIAEAACIIVGAIAEICERLDSARAAGEGEDG